MTDTEEQKPDYRHWSQQKTFKLIDAAYLLCDYEPRNAVKHPKKVIGMLNSMKREGLKIETKKRTLSHTRQPGGFNRKTLYGTEPSKSETIQIEEYVTRRELEKWCEHTGRKAAFPHQDERHRSSPEKPCRKPRREFKRALTIAIDDALERLKIRSRKEPTVEALWAYFENDEDATAIIIRTEGDTVVWQTKERKESRTKFVTLKKRVAEINRSKSKKSYLPQL